MTDHINPGHYKQHPAFGIECYELTRFMDFTAGNAVKYLWRSGRKGDRLEDLRKAYWYLEHLPAPNISIIPQQLVDVLAAQARLYLEDRESDVEWLTVAAILHLILDDRETAKDMVQTAIQRVSH
ncbi:DUF3310 domain-containing protein [Corynebacterium sp. AOP40-4SA-5]|uniref:DUF3310 domain-containing protein n=1 Tax=Corynebacterium sp. AOP40-4SA-5 TaxID=3457678 RepID=UPI0040337C7C